MAHWVKSDIDIDFIGRRKKFWVLSSVLVLTSLGAILFNVFVRGDAFNYGTDFKGGSQIQIEFRKKLETAAVRAALAKAGFKKAEVVSMAGDERPNLMMLRLTEVSTFSPEQRQRAEKELKAEFKKDFRRLDHRAGGDKLYIVFSKKLEIKVEKGEDPGKAVVERIKAALKKASVSIHQAQLFGRSQDATFEVVLGGLGEELNKALESALGKGIVKDIPQVESVGAKMGKQLRNDGIKSVMYALLLMLVYIAFRFDFRYAPGAVVALAHDVTITVGIFAITWTEFSLPVVAALLTIAGYSINDTIVVYDRIRENLARMRDRKFPRVVNTSVNETLSRTILTSLTTLFTCVAIWTLGAGVLRNFAFALTIGVVIGTYSSIFIASPLVVLLNERYAAAKKKVRAR